MQKYEVKKTVRFKLIPIIKNSENLKVSLEKQINLEKFIKNLENYLNKFKNTFFYDKEKHIFKNKIEIKYKWLQEFTRNNFYEFLNKNNKNKKYKLSEINYLPVIFKDRFQELENIINNLKIIENLPEENQEKRSKIAYFIRQLAKKDNFDFITSFIKYISNSNNPYLDKDLKNLQQLADFLKNDLLLLINSYLPSQSAWLEVVKASFNYYTIDKYSNINFEDKLNEKKAEQRQKIKEIRDNDRSFSKKFYWQSIKLDEKFFNKIWIKENLYEKTLEEAYDFIKNFKANAKSHLISDLGKEEFTTYTKSFNTIKKEERKDYIQDAFDLTYENFQKVHPLFDMTEEDFNELMKLSKEVRELANKKNKILQNYWDIKSKELEEKIQNKKLKNQEITEEENKFLEINELLKIKKEERWKFFNKPWQKVYTKNYYLLNELFKDIAIKRWFLKAEIAGIEEEQNQARLLKYWSLITEKDWEKYLILIPKENRKEVKNKIEELNNDWDIKIYYFKSLTLNALKKLCFKKIGNTFIKPVFQELLFKDDNKPYFKTNKRWKKQLKRYDELNEKELIIFYQDVLKSEAANRQLDLVDFWELNKIFEKDYRNIEEFRIDLEKVCYTKLVKWIDDYNYNKLINENNIIEFKITSQDLKILEEKDEKIFPKHKNKEHTQKWLNFWSKENPENYYPTRLNPEIKILYRDKLLERENWKKETRFNKEQFTLSTTLGLNIPSKRLEFRFDKTNTIKEKVEFFNEKFNKEFKWEWNYWIDRWINELATLSIIKWKDETYTYNWKTIQKPEFARIKVYKLKDENVTWEVEKYDWTKKEVKVIDNISYFTGQENLFESFETWVIDLTQAKLINWKIILNWDKNTYMKLKLLSAKRRIFELFANWKITELKFERWKNILFFLDKDNYYYPIYWFTEEQKQNKSLIDEIEKKLNNYFKYIQKNNLFEDNETIEKINHLRDAITANIVWIINFLQKQFPWKIFLENLDKTLLQREKFSYKKWNDGELTQIEEKMIDWHFQQSNTDISRRLEWWFYRKFQEDWLVPSNLKQTIFLKDDFW